MAQEPLGFIDYLKEAARYQPRLPLLGRFPAHPLGIAAFAVLGLANPGFWLLGLAAETVYLLGMASSERFQKLVQATRQAESKESYQSQVHQALARLSPASRARYQRLLDECQRIQGLSDAADPDRLIGLRHARTGGLNQLLWIFLRLLSSRELLAETLERTSRDVLQREIRRIEERIEAERATNAESPLLRSLEGTLDIQRKRLENFDRAVASLSVIDAELERIEQQVVLIREETAVSGKAELLSSRLDAVSGALSETNRWMEQNAEIFGSLGADPLGSAPSELPVMPAIESER